MLFVLVFLGASAEAECNCHQSHKSNVFHNSMFFCVIRQPARPLV
jgi:hypothetical protein